MKKNLLFTVLLTIALSSVMSAQDLTITNGSFEDPSENLKLRADGLDDGEFNGNVPGWWADTNATDCGRQNNGKVAQDSSYAAYAYTNDGSIWALAGTIGTEEPAYDVSFYANTSWAPDAADPEMGIILAVYEGTDTVGFTVLDTLSSAYTGPGYQLFEFVITSELLAQNTGKNLLIGYDAFTSDATDSWYLFDNFVLTAQVGSGISNNNTSLSSVKVFPNPANNNLTVQLDNEYLSTYSLYGITGKNILNGFVQGVKVIDVSNVENGIYFLKIENTEGSQLIMTIIE